MRYQGLVAFAGSVFAIVALPALAQNDGATEFPDVCRSDMKMPGAMNSESGMSAMQGHQAASMDGMRTMYQNMVQAMMQNDADVAFVCGMIAHHQGAIDMAKVELQEGDDQWAKKMAQKVIDAQTQEIVEMTDWLRKNAK